MQTYPKRREGGNTLFNRHCCSVSLLASSVVILTEFIVAFSLLWCTSVNLFYICEEKSSHPMLYSHHGQSVVHRKDTCRTSAVLVASKAKGRFELLVPK